MKPGPKPVECECIGCGVWIGSERVRSMRICRPCFGLFRAASDRRRKMARRGELPDALAQLGVRGLVERERRIVRHAQRVREEETCES